MKSALASLLGLFLLFVWVYWDTPRKQQEDRERIEKLEARIAELEAKHD